MKLGNLLDRSTIRQMQATAAVASWHKKPDQERMQLVQNRCSLEMRKLEKFIPKFAKQHCTEALPAGPKVMAEWAIKHAAALAGNNPEWHAKECLEHSLYDIFTLYGSTEFLGTTAARYGF